MSSEYWTKVLNGLDEPHLQDILSEVYKNRGWEVKNMHRIDPKSEEGADLEIRKGTEKILVAVKYKPNKKDIDQLKTLWLRKAEAKLVYAYSTPSTGAFAKEADKLDGDIEFLTGNLNSP